MKNKKALLSALIILITFLLPVPELCAQQSGQDADGSGRAGTGAEKEIEEAQKAIFDFNVGDGEAELFLTGSWKLGIGGSAAFLFHPLSGLRSDFAFPGWIPGFLLEQVPDITLSLWILDRYFFETTFLPGSPFNTLLFGYRGKEDEFLQSVLVGNTGIDISPYPYLSFSESAANLPGVSAEFKTDISTHELLLRYEPTSGGRKTFVGMNELTEERVELDDYIKGRYFLLPDAGIGSVIVLLEDRNGTISAGDGRSYRQLNGEEVAVSNDTGSITLSREARGRLLVYYEKAGTPVGDGSLGNSSLIGVSGSYPELSHDDTIVLDFDFSGTLSGGDYDNLFSFIWREASPTHDFTDLQVNVGTKDYLLLYEPGFFSPFEQCNRYHPATMKLSASSVAEIHHKDTNTPAALNRNIRPLIREERNTIEVRIGGLEAENPLNRLPFISEAPAVYGRGLPSADNSADIELTVRSLNPVASLSAGSSLIPGSVRVIRNGAEIYSFTVNYETGEISLAAPVNPSDVIELYYRSYSPEGSGGDLLFAGGNKINLSDRARLDLAMGLRWNVRNDSYSLDPDDHPGSLALSALFSYQEEHFQFKSDLGLSFFNPDTSGYLRLLGMEETEYQLPLNQTTIFPSSIPLTTPQLIDAYGAGKTNRGKLLYKDYWIPGPLGSVSLASYTYTSPQVYDYVDGNPSGPYLASAAEEGIDDPVMVMDFSMDAGDWVGAVVQTPEGAALDFSTASSIDFQWKTADISGSFDVYVHFGTIGEDLDGDGALDAELSELSNGFPFNDTGNGVTLYLGGVSGGASVQTEDSDGDGLLESDTESLIIARGSAGAAFTPLLALPAETWSTVSIDRNSFDFDKLKQVKGIRIILAEKSGSSPAGGKLLVTPPQIRGSRMYSRTSGPGTIRGREIAEASVPAAESLGKAHPESSSVFHSGTSESKSLEITWSGMSSGSWSSSAYTTAVPPGQYDSFSFYLLPYDLGAGTGDISVSFTDSRGRGLHASFSAGESDRWQKVSISIPNAGISINGNPVSGTVSRDSTGNKWSHFTVSLAGVTAGTVYLDEVHLHDPRPGIGIGSSLSVSYKHPGPLLSSGETVLLGNFSVEEEAFVSSEAFMSGSTEESLDDYGSVTRAGIEVLYTRLEGEIAFGGTLHQSHISGGHSIIFPAVPFPISLTDSYYRSYYALPETMSRQTKLRAADDDLGSLILSSESFLREDTLHQNWLFHLSSSWDFPFGFSLEGSLGQRSTGFLLPESSYPVSWIQSYSYLLPLPPAAGREREGSIDFLPALEPKPVGLRLPFRLSYYNEAAEEGEQKNEGSLAVELPMVFSGDAAGDWSITFGIRRDFTHFTHAASPGDFASDLGTLGTGIAGEHYLYESLPLIELFSPYPETVFFTNPSLLDYAEYRPAAYFNFSRPFGARLVDFFLPSSLETEITRQFKKEGDSLTALSVWNMSLSTIAVNLFGSFGAYPVFSFYKSDEFSSNISISHSLYEISGMTETSFRLGNSLYLFGDNDSSFGIEHDLLIEVDTDSTVSDSISLFFSWKSDFVNFLNIDFFDDPAEYDPYYEHREKLDLTIRDGGRSWDRNLLTMTIGHETNLIVPETGSIRMYADLGWGLTPAEINGMRQELFFLGIRGGIEGRIRW